MKIFAYINMYDSNMFILKIFVYINVYDSNIIIHYESLCSH
jgi:hypothetical protein